MKKYGLLLAALVVVVLAVPMVSFGADASFDCSPINADGDIRGVAPFKIICTDKSGGANTWCWRFGDESTPETECTSNEPNPEHVYSTPNGYAIQLSIDGGASTSVTVVYVDECPLSSLPVKLVRPVPNPPACPALVEDRFPTLQDAYNYACDGDTIKAFGLKLIPQNLTAQHDVTLTIKGGYVCSPEFDDLTGVVNNTILPGMVSIESGAVTMGDFTLNQQ